MNEKERKKLEEVLESVRPYITNSSDLKDAVIVTSKESSNLEDFLEKFKEIISDEEDPSMKTDLKIFLNKLESH